jgi:hypothetical protein
MKIIVELESRWLRASDTDEIERAVKRWVHEAVGEELGDLDVHAFVPRGDGGG